MFSADGKFIIKENYESDVNEINKKQYKNYFIRDNEGKYNRNTRIIYHISKKEIREKYI